MTTASNTNRKLKDSLYTALFNDAEVIAEFYYGVTGRRISPDAIVKINTFKNILGRGKPNDVSFEVDGKLMVFAEHQSTIDMSIAYRFLLFTMKQYNLRNTDKRSVYNPTLPRPEFYVLYNGTREMAEDSRVIRLSELFSDPVPAGVTPGLELTVTMYNINKGRNPEMAKRSPTLNGYETLIRNIRVYDKTMSHDAAVNKAVLEAIDDNTEQWGALKKLLKERKGEIMDLLDVEWTVEDYATAMVEMQARQIATALLKRGMAVDDVVSVTRLDLNDVLKLKARI